MFLVAGLIASLVLSLLISKRLAHAVSDEL